jgi:hypothetical protein
VFSDLHFGSLFGTEQRVLDATALASLATAIRMHADGCTGGVPT